MQDFCEACRAETTDFGPGNIGTANGTGVIWFGGERPCARCGSVVRKLKVSMLFIPLPGGGKYRVIDLGHGNFLARALAPLGGPDKSVSHCPACRRQFYNAMVEACPDCHVRVQVDVPTQSPSAR